MEDNIEYAKLDFSEINPLGRVKLLTVLQKCIDQNRESGNADEEPLNQALLDYQESLISCLMTKWKTLSIKYNSNLYRILEQNLESNGFELNKKFTFANVTVIHRFKDDVEYVDLDFTKICPFEKPRLIKFLTDAINQSDGEVKKALMDYLSKAMALPIETWKNLSIKYDSKPYKFIEKYLTSYAFRLNEIITDCQAEIAVLPGEFDVLYLDSLNEPAKRRCAEFIRMIYCNTSDRILRDHLRAAYDYCINKNTECNILHISKQLPIEQYMYNNGIKFVKKGKSCCEAIKETGGMDNVNFGKKSWEVFYKDEIARLSSLNSKSKEESSSPKSKTEFLSQKSKEEKEIKRYFESPTYLEPLLPLDLAYKSPAQKAQDSFQKLLTSVSHFDPKTFSDIRHVPNCIPKETAIMVDLPDGNIILHLDSINKQIREKFLSVIDKIYSKTFVVKYLNHLATVRNYCFGKDFMRDNMCNIMYFEKNDHIMPVLEFFKEHKVNCALINSEAVDPINQSGGINGIKLAKKSWSDFCKTIDQLLMPGLKPPTAKRPKL